ncbi:MAG: DnaJ domain-containing protein [Oscillospiraceae bacterium]|nr:DnaJ domain-containing protein [Oscillospiraceae bacterium]
MRDPYSVLGVSKDASDDEIRASYKELARKYSDESSASAEKKMRELNEAYDAIVMQRGGLGQSSHSSSSNSGRTSGYYGGSAQQSDYSDIREKIRSGRIEDALMLLDGIPQSSRNAEWYYLKGVAQQRRGWLDYAAENFAKACSMDPSNREYAAAKSNLENSKNGGFRTSNRRSGGCDACDVCSGLLCADCCCECCGGDLIPCC